MLPVCTESPQGASRPPAIAAGKGTHYPGFRLIDNEVAPSHGFSPRKRRLNENFVLCSTAKPSSARNVPRQKQAFRPIGEQRHDYWQSARTPFLFGFGPFLLFYSGGAMKFCGEC